MYMGTDSGKALMYISNFAEGAPPDGYGRTVLHCDGNAFFASCETALHPEYARVPMAVCGSTEDRHGIVLAKNELAKRYGVATAEPVWQAKKKCPQLLTVRPTYGLYDEMSAKMNAIFRDYTDLVEPFGVDESWLDVTGSARLFGSGEDIAAEIRRRVKEELALTVSVGVSFNKVFAKLGSDMKKPDATTVIPYKSFASAVWRLPVSALLFAGPSVTQRLGRVGIYTIGDLAAADGGFIGEYLGKSGLMLREFARGNDFAPVRECTYRRRPESVGQGMTFRRNLVSEEDISFAVKYLSMGITRRLRGHSMCCRTLAVAIRGVDLSVRERRTELTAPTCVSEDLAAAAKAIINGFRRPGEEIYSLTLRAERLAPSDGRGVQQTMFRTSEEERYEKRLSLESAVDKICERYGKNTVKIASAVNNGLI